MAKEVITGTVGELRRDLERFTDETELMIGDGNLTLDKVKGTGPRGTDKYDLAQIRFKEWYTIVKPCDS